jgi:hypothetical protein
MLLMGGGGGGLSYSPRKDIEHWSGKASRLASGGKMIPPGEFCWNL